MGVRPHGNTLAGRKDGRTHVIEEDERPKGAPPRRGQDTPHCKFAEILFARTQNEIDTLWIIHVLL